MSLRDGEEGTAFHGFRGGCWRSTGRLIRRDAAHRRETARTADNPRAPAANPAQALNPTRHELCFPKDGAKAQRHGGVGERMDQEKMRSAARVSPASHFVSPSPASHSLKLGSPYQTGVCLVMVTVQLRGLASRRDVIGSRARIRTKLRGGCLLPMRLKRGGCLET
jgi:hypothetical protein